MFLVINHVRQLQFGQLMEVYFDSNLQNGKIEYAHLDDRQKLFEAEQDHYAFLQEFFKISGSFLCVWAPGGVYKAALRMEPYKDGFLMEGLETAPDSRRQGYATELILQMMKYLADTAPSKVYSHIAKENIPSIMLHERCGFTRLKDHAVFIDGSVDHRTYTYVIDILK